MKRIYVFAMLFIFLMFGLCGYVTAEETGARMWLSLGSVSYHPDRTKGYNERNAGIGFEYTFTENSSVMVGRYNNSVRQDSNYLAYKWQPITAFNDHIKLGISAGYLDGYPAMNGGKGFLAVIPMMSFEYSRIGVNVGFIPKMPRVDAALAFQFKIGF